MKSLVLVLLNLLAIITISGAYNSLDLNGNITINWDILTWTPDGYVAVVGVKNNQKFRPITRPGWKLGWTWSGREIIWSTMGSQTTRQGDCSRFKGNVPTSCLRRPTVVDLSPAAPYNQQISNCCKSGILTPLAQDPHNSVAQFQISVGMAGTTKKTVKLPKKFTLLGPGPGYTCGPAKVVLPTLFTTPHGLRTTQALMTFRVVCKYSPFRASKRPSCCVSYNASFTHCPSTSPIHIRWSFNLISKSYSASQIVIYNSNHWKSITPWNMVLRYPGLHNLTRVSSEFNFKSFTWNRDTGVLVYSKRHENDVLKSGERLGMELEMERHKTNFPSKSESLKVYFNGDECKLPSHA